MMQQEFEDRVKIRVSSQEYTAIEVVYMNSDLEKDEFCKLWAKMNAKRIAAHRKSEKEKQEKHERVKFLHSTMCRMRNFAYENGWSSSSEKFITVKVRKSLEKANIDYMEFDYIKMQYDYKPVASIVHEIQKYIDNQVVVA